MFSTDELIADCRGALQTSSSERAIQQIARRAVSNGAAVARALGAPSRSGIVPVYQSQELTILNIVWSPGMSILPHDHRMWAVIAVYEGREENSFYERTAAGLLRTSSTSVAAGDAVLLDANVIHAVTNPLRRFTAALQIYGGDFFNVARSEFDPATLKERPFDIERAKAAFLDANQRPSADVVAPVKLVGAARDGSGRREVTRVLEMKVDLVLLCLVVAWCASPSTADAQTPPSPAHFEKHEPAVGTRAYSCVDPSDVLARRWFQDQPCRWPMYHLPAAAVPSSNEPLPFPKYPQPSAGVQAGHAMFWRLPVQPMGPYDAPRHTFH